MKKLVSIFLMLMLLGLVSAGCSLSQSQPNVEQPKQDVAAEKPKELRQVVISGPSDSLYLVGPIHMAQKKGFYQEEGIDPKLVTAQASTVIAGLVSGEIDYSYAVSSVVNAAARGMPLKSLMTFITSHNWSFMTAPDIKTPEQLIGKTVAVTNVGDTTYQLSSMSLRKLGLDPQRDVNFVSAGPIPQLVQTFMGGAFEGAVVSEPLASMLMTKGYNAHIFLGDIVNMLGFGLATHDNKLTENPEEVKGVLRAALRGLQYFKREENKDEIIEFITKQYKVSNDIAKGGYESTLKIMSLDGTITKAQYDATIELAREELGLKVGETIPFEQVVNLKLLEQVQKELGL